MRVALISLEPWDEVWRRNQHFASQLCGQGLVSELLFVEPPLLTHRPGTVRQVAQGVAAVRPSLRVPKRAGGLALIGRLLRATALRGIDVLWINDAVLGVHCLTPGVPAVYDVTDDWREFDFPDRIRRRLLRAEDALAVRARTVVCSSVLRQRWADRYGVDAAVVHNGVDTASWAAAEPVPLAGPGPHVGYIGTLHEERLDIDLVLRTASHPAVGTLHLVGPDALSDVARDRLGAHPRIMIHGPVPSAQVPRWTKAMDVLLSPHLVSPFTLSLDAIKSYEYLVSGRPVVATPTSGFQVMAGLGLRVAPADAYPDAVGAALSDGQVERHGAFDWGDRAAQFAEELRRAGRP